MAIRYKRFLIFGLILICTIAPASANAGTLLVWLGTGQLFVGNFFVALFEANIAERRLHKYYHLKSQLFGLMALANFLSFIVGFFCLFPSVDYLSPIVLGQHPIANLPWMVGVVFLFAFLISMLIEWPLLHLGVYLANKAEPLPKELWRITLTVNCIAQLFSYLILGVLYLLVSGTTLLTQVKRERTLEFVKTPQAEVYYRPLNGDGYYRVRLDGAAPQRVKMTEQPFVNMVTKYYGDDINLWQRGFGYALDLRPVGERSIKATTGFWAVSGLRVDSGNSSYKIAMEMPYFMWFSRSATILPGDQVVYQVGNFLVVFDLHTRQIADLGPGKNPVVIIPGVKYQPEEKK